MINLLPDNEKKALAAEYHLRLAAVSLAAAIAVVAVTAVLLVPSFLLATFKESGLAGRAAAESAEETKEYEELSDRVAAANKLAKSLRLAASTTPPVALLSVVTGARPAGVEVTGIAYELRDGAPTLTVKGVAPTRRELVAFSDALRRDPLISSVTVPASNLAKDADIPFSFEAKAK